MYQQSSIAAASSLFIFLASSANGSNRPFPAIGFMEILSQASSVFEPAYISVPFLSKPNIKYMLQSLISASVSPFNQSAIFKKIQVFTILLPLIFIFATILLPTYLQVNCWLANSKSTNQIILVFTSKSSMSTQLQNHNTQLLFQFITFNISEFNNCQLKSVSFQKCCGANCYKNLYLALLRKYENL